MSKVSVTTKLMWGYHHNGLRSKTNDVIVNLKRTTTRNMMIGVGNDNNIKSHIQQWSTSFGLSDTHQRTHQSSSSSSITLRQYHHSTTNTVAARSSTSSVSTNEVNKFSKLSKSWWDPKQNPLIGMNAIRMQYVTSQMKKIKTNTTTTASENTNTTAHTLPPLHGFKALDVGCGGGLLSESLARLGATVTAVDPSIELVQQAQQHALLDPRTAQSIDYRGGYTVEKLAHEYQDVTEHHESDLFDIICLLEVIEHVTDIPSIIHASRSLLKPDTGRLFVSTINRTWKSHVTAIVGAEYLLRYLPPGTHNWNQFLSPNEFQQYLRRSENGIDDTIGHWQELDVSGMAITKFPWNGQWQWKLDPHDMDINWIGTYRKTTKAAAPDSNEQ